MDTFVCYIPENKLFKYGKVIKNYGGLKVFPLSSVTPTEPSPRLVNLDDIIDMAPYPANIVYLAFIIEGLEDELIFRFNNYSTLKKILYGEVGWKSKYCSEIFFNIKFMNNNVIDFNSEIDKLLLFKSIEERHLPLNNLFLYTYKWDDCIRRLGFAIRRTRLFNGIICPLPNYRVIDVYCDFRNLDINDANEVVFRDSLPRCFSSL